jgi:hypothetical protein
MDKDRSVAAHVAWSDRLGTTSSPLDNGLAQLIAICKQPHEGKAFVGAAQGGKRVRGERPRDRSAGRGCSRERARARRQQGEAYESGTCDSVAHPGRANRDPREAPPRRRSTTRRSQSPRWDPGAEGGTSRRELTAGRIVTSRSLFPRREGHAAGAVIRPQHEAGGRGGMGLEDQVVYGQPNTRYDGVSEATLSERIACDGHAQAHDRDRLGHRLTLVLHRQAAPGIRAADVPGATAR